MTQGIHRDDVPVAPFREAYLLEVEVYGQAPGDLAKRVGMDVSSLRRSLGLYGKQTTVRRLTAEKLAAAFGLDPVDLGL